MTTQPTDLPTFFTVGTLNSIGKKDAQQYVRGLITRHCTSPDDAAFHLAKRNDGWAYEIQEGGAGRAYLPAILAKLDREPSTPVFVKTAGRVAILTMSSEGHIDLALQPESFVGEDIHFAWQRYPEKSGPKLKRCEPDHSRTLVAAVAVSAASFVVLAMAITTSVIVSDSPTEDMAALVTTKAKDLPIAHWPSNIREDEFVFAVRFDGKKWSEEKTKITVSHQQASAN